LIDQEIYPVGEVDWDWADIVLLSGMIEQKTSLLSLIAEAKDRGKVVVVGGAHGTLEPDDCLRAGCDFLVKGEAENTMDQLLSALDGGTNGTVIENTNKSDISRSPVPRFELLDFSQYLTMGVQASRGCPYDSEFCCVSELAGRKQRYKTPGQIINELEALYNLGWRGEVFFTDDNFVGNRAQASAILERLTPWLRTHSEPIEFHTHVSVELGHDPDMMDRLTEANFTTLYIGIESTDPEVLERAHKSHNLKIQPLELVRNMRGKGLIVVGHFVMGFDGEEAGSGDRIAAFIEASDMPLAFIHILQALPGTRLRKRLESENRLLPNRRGMDTIPGRPNFVTTRPEHEIIGEYDRCWGTVFDPSRYLARTYRYLLSLPPRRFAPPLFRGESLGRLGAYLLAFLRLIWYQGIRSSVRRQFWAQLADMLKRNPTRVFAYLATCAVGENMFELSELVQRAGRDAEGQAPHDART